MKIYLLKQKVSGKNIFTFSFEKKMEDYFYFPTNERKQSPLRATPSRSTTKSINQQQHPSRFSLAFPGGVHDYYAALQQRDYFAKKDQEEFRRGLYEEIDLTEQTSQTPQAHRQRNLLFNNTKQGNAPKLVSASVFNATKEEIEAIERQERERWVEEETEFSYVDENGVRHFERKFIRRLRTEEELKLYRAKSNQDRNYYEENGGVGGRRLKRNGTEEGDEDNNLAASGSMRNGLRPGRLPPKRAPDIKPENVAQQEHVFDEFDYLDEYAEAKAGTAGTTAASAAVPPKNTPGKEENSTSAAVSTEQVKQAPDALASSKTGETVPPVKVPPPAPAGKKAMPGSLPPKKAPMPPKVPPAAPAPQPPQPASK
jgi:hypothetical protein